VIKGKRVNGEAGFGVEISCEFKSRGDSFSCNRPYRLFTFHPMASFSCQILTHVLCAVGLKITLLLSLRTARNKFVQENMGIYNLYLTCENKLTWKNEAIG
jgi:hypothetical protein